MLGLLRALRGPVHEHARSGLPRSRVAFAPVRDLRTGRAMTRERKIRSALDFLEAPARDTPPALPRAPGRGLERPGATSAAPEPSAGASGALALERRI